MRSDSGSLEGKSKERSYIIPDLIPRVTRGSPAKCANSFYGEEQTNSILGRSTHILEEGGTRRGEGLTIQYGSHKNRSVNRPVESDVIEMSSLSLESLVDSSSGGEALLCRPEASRQGLAWLLFRRMKQRG